MSDARGVRAHKIPRTRGLELFSGPFLALIVIVPGLWPFGLVNFSQRLESACPPGHKSRNAASEVVVRSLFESLCSLWLRMSFKRGEHAAGSGKIAQTRSLNVPRKLPLMAGNPRVRHGPNTVSEGSVSNTELQAPKECGWRSPGAKISHFCKDWQFLLFNGSDFFLVCQSDLTEFFAELTELAAECSEFSLLIQKQHSRNSTPLVS